MRRTNRPDLHAAQEKYNKEVDWRFRQVLFVTVVLAVLFSFLPGFSVGGREMQWGPLHVFLFNLTAGGLLLTTVERSGRGVDLYAIMYYMFALLFSVAAAFTLPAILVLSAFILFLLAEGLRWKYYGWFPLEFFRAEPVSKKFAHASILCLSLGLLICTAAIFARQFLHLPLPKKLDLHVFYLGLSFPLSLRFFADIFAHLEKGPSPPRRTTAEGCFWALNVGVILFFFFIIFENYAGQMLMALLLFSVVLVTILLHFRQREKEALRPLLTSGLFFLLLGSLTGIAYIAVLWREEISSSLSASLPGELSELRLGRKADEFLRLPLSLLSFHAAATVFGWNLSWMILAVRRLTLRPAAGLTFLLPLHWLFVFLLSARRLHEVVAALACVLGSIFCGRAFLGGDDEKKQEKDFLIAAKRESKTNVSL